MPWWSFTWVIIQWSQRSCFDLQHRSFKWSSSDTIFVGELFDTALVVFLSPYFGLAFYCFKTNVVEEYLGRRHIFFTGCVVASRLATTCKWHAMMTDHIKPPGNLLFKLNQTFIKLNMIALESLQALTLQQCDKRHWSIDELTTCQLTNKNQLSTRTQNDPYTALWIKVWYMWITVWYIKGGVATASEHVCEICELHLHDPWSHLSVHSVKEPASFLRPVRHGEDNAFRMLEQKFPFGKVSGLVLRTSSGVEVSTVRLSRGGQAFQAASCPHLILMAGASHALCTRGYSFVAVGIRHPQQVWRRTEQDVSWSVPRAW